MNKARAVPPIPHPNERHRIGQRVQFLLAEGTLDRASLGGWWWCLVFFLPWHVEPLLAGMGVTETFVSNLLSALKLRCHEKALDVWLPACHSCQEKFNWCSVAPIDVKPLNRNHVWRIQGFCFRVTARNCSKSCSKKRPRQGATCRGPASLSARLGVFIQS